MDRVAEDTFELVDWLEIEERPENDRSDGAKEAERGLGRRLGDAEGDRLAINGEDDGADSISSTVFTVVLEQQDNSACVTLRQVTEMFVGGCRSRSKDSCQIMFKIGRGPDN